MNLMQKTLVGISVLSLMSASSFASGVGNGGVSMVCRDANERILSAELLDIYEGKVRYGKKYNNSLNSDTKVELAQLKLINHPDFLSAFQKELARVLAILMYVPVGNILTPTNDAFPTILKKGCVFEQVANYTDDGDLLVSQEIHNHLSEVNKAALLVHETVYAIFRGKGATDSRQARKLTAELLAQNADQKVIDEILGGTEGSCGLRGNIERRIKNCNKKKGNFALVARTVEGYEVYKDLLSGLLWGDRLSSTMNHYWAEQACDSDLKEVAGISDVTWRLPTIEEYKKAEQNGVRKALPNMNYLFWSSLAHHGNSGEAWLFDGVNGVNYYYYRSNNYSARCVAR